MTFPGRYLIGFLFYFLATTAAAQYRIDSWTADDGLPQNSVYAMVQTRDGYLWIATLDGLARFDGVRFTIFNKSNSPGITNNRFVALFEDSSGDLWAATEESGVVRFSNGRFSSYGEENGIPRSVTWINGDTNGKAVFYVNGTGAFTFSDNRFVQLKQDGSFRPTWNRRSISIGCAVAPGNSLICHPQGYEVSFPAADFNLDGFYAAMQNGDGSVWMVTGGREVARFSNGEMKIALRRADLLQKRPRKFVTGVSTHLISTDDSDSLWITDLSSLTTELLLPRSDEFPAQPGDLHPLNANEDIFYSSYGDGEGNLWFGTLRGGLYRARKQIITTLSSRNGLTENNIYPIFQSSGGVMWVGTTGGLYTQRGDRFELAATTDALSISTIGELSDGRIVFSNEGELHIQDGNRFVRYLDGVVPTLGAIFAIHGDPAGNLWIGGFDRLTQVKNGSVTAYTPADGLVGDSIKTIINARSGGIWVGSYGGLSRFQDGRFTTWTEADGLPSRTVRTLYEDAEGILWIGTYDGGLTRFKDGKFVHYSTSSGLFNDGVFQILEDDNGWFWISSNRGIYRVKKSELNEFADGTRTSITSIGYGKSDGMLNVECNGGRWPAGIRTADGQLWFPTQNGVAVIDPKAVKINSQTPPVAIESVRIGDRSLELNAVTAATQDPDFEIRLEPHEQNFEIQYTALSFINSENLRFKYRLEGLDDDWIDAGTRRTAYFSYVPPGSYRFQILAANSDGVWNTEGRSLRFTIRPPFYRTWPFMLLAAASLIAALLLIYWWRVSKLRADKQAQEAFSRRLIDLQENERKRLAGELHDGLSQNLVIIKNRAMMSLAERENVDHAFEQIEEIVEAASDSLTEVREIAANLRPFQIDRLGLTKAIESLVRKTNSANLQVTARLDSIDGILSSEMEINLYRILQESLNNIIKHSSASEAKIEILRSERTLAVAIKDNGKGFDAGVRHDMTKKGGGFGLVGMSERARILGSPLQVESTTSGGTVIRLKFNY